MSGTLLLLEGAIVQDWLEFQFSNKMDHMEGLGWVMIRCISKRSCT